MILSASEIALAESDPFGLWHDHYGDESLAHQVGPSRLTDFKSEYCKKKPKLDLKTGNFDIKNTALRKHQYCNRGQAWILSR